MVVPPFRLPTSAEMRQIARKWELFVTGVEVDLSDVPPIIREAWIRSKQAGVDPGLSQAPWHEISNDPATLHAEIDWLPCAENVFSLLAQVFNEPHQILCLVDQQARLLSVRGGREAMARAEKIHAVPGGEWSEQKVGCNVYGTSLYTGLPVQVCWSEYYIANWQDWASYAVPLHDPVTGDSVGAIGIGGHQELSHPRASELVMQAATMIEERMQQQEAMTRLSILERFAQLVARYPADGLLALDRHGRILTLSPAIEKMLSLPHSRLVGQAVQNVAALREHLGLLSKATSAQELLAHEPIPGVTFFPVPLGRATGAIILLSPPARPSVVKRQSEQPWATTYTFADLLGQSPLFRECMTRAQKASLYDWPVLLLGESGTGKELFAQSIHHASERYAGPFVPLDCASVSDDLIGMELFGYEEGAFTGARKGGKPGKIQLAHEGTLFLDDVDNLPPKVQVSLLRVLEAGQVVPLGGSKPRRIDIRVIAASNSDLAQLVREGKFRHDLYHRLSVVTLTLPPLRERTADIPLLAQHIFSHHSPQMSVTEEALATLRQYPWPGNVRELKNVLLEAVTYTQSQCITAADLPPAIMRAATSVTSQSRRQVLDSAEAELIVQVLQETESVAQAARRLGLHRATLYVKMKKYGISLPRSRKTDVN